MPNLRPLILSISRSRPAPHAASTTRYATPRTEQDVAYCGSAGASVGSGLGAGLSAGAAGGVSAFGLRAAVRFGAARRLVARADPARCWAHCTQEDGIFYWSRGENSWIVRTHAASELGQYVTKLRNEGCRCHIVAHSHGGNVVAEAMPQIAAPNRPGPLGKILTLGTPFMDIVSPILKAFKRRQSSINVFAWMGFVLMIVVLLVNALGYINAVGLHPVRLTAS